MGGGPRALVQIVGVARQAAAAVVGELVVGQGDRDLLRARVADPQGPFGAATVGLLLTRLHALAGQEGDARQAALAGIEADLAGRARAFHAGLAGQVNGYGWVRHPAAGAPAGGTSPDSHALPTEYAEHAAGRGDGDQPSTSARAPRRVFTTQEKAALVRQYQEVRSQGTDEARWYLEVNNVTRAQLSRWQQELALPQAPASPQDQRSLPAGYGNPEPGRAVPDYLDLPGIGPVEAYTLDDLPLTRRRHTRQEKFALLTEYAGLERHQTRRWLHDHHLTTSQMSVWRRAGEVGLLGEGDLPPLARPPRRVFTIQEKAAWVRQYQEVKSQGTDEARRWLEANNLTSDLVRRWRRELASPQAPAPASPQAPAPAPPLSGHGSPEPGRAVADYLDLPEIGPVEAASTLDDLPLTYRSHPREEKLALLTEYAQLEWGQGRQWLRDHHLNSGDLSAWRRAGEAGQLGIGNLAPAARAVRRVFTTREKAALVRQYEEAKSQGRDEARGWLEAHNLHREQVGRWRREFAPPQGLASSLSGDSNPEPSRAVLDYLDLPEVGAVEAYTLDDLPRTCRRYTRQEKLALLTEYARLEGGQRGRWLHDHHLTASLMCAWRRVWGEGRLGDGDLPPAAVPARRAFTPREKAALVRQYDEAKSQGPGGAKRWREANNLTRDLVNRWRRKLASRQHPAPQPSGYGNPEPSRVASDDVDLPEINPVEASTLDDLPRTRRSYTGQEKLDLLTEYTHLDQGQTGQWVRDHHLTYSQISDWQRLRREGLLGEGGLLPTMRAPRRVFTTQEKAALVRQYQEARSQGPDEARRWLEANNLHRNLLNRWQQELALPLVPAPLPSGHGNPEPTMVEVDPAGGEGVPPDARLQPVGTAVDGAEPSGVNEYLVDPLETWWATALASATGTPDALDAWGDWEAWGDWDQGNGQGTAEPDRHHEGSSSSWRSF
jgi:transposase-like protein